jgi:hypothetical protein
MTHGIRRVVTTHGANGKAVIASDGPAPNVRRREASGITSTPVIGGLLLARHLDLRSIFLLSALPALCAAVAIMVMRRGARVATAPAPAVEEVP